MKMILAEGDESDVPLAGYFRLKVTLHDYIPEWFAKTLCFQTFFEGEET